MAAFVVVFPFAVDLRGILRRERRTGQIECGSRAGREFLKAEASDEAEDRSLDMGAVGNRWMGAFLCVDGVTLSDEQKSGQDGHACKRQRGICVVS